MCGTGGNEFLEEWGKEKMKKEMMKAFMKDESGVGVVEMILILVVLIGLVLIFKNQLKSLVDGIFKEIQTKTNTIYS